MLEVTGYLLGMPSSFHQICCESRRLACSESGATRCIVLVLHSPIQFFHSVQLNHSCRIYAADCYTSWASVSISLIKVWSHAATSSLSSAGTQLAPSSGKKPPRWGGGRKKLSRRCPLITDRVIVCEIEGRLIHRPGPNCAAGFCPPV